MPAPDLFWAPEKDALVLLTPTAAAQWPFAAERSQPFLVTHNLPDAQHCWITPADPSRRWHSSPISWADLMPDTNQPA